MCQPLEVQANLFNFNIEVQKRVNQDIMEFFEAHFSEIKNMNLETGGRPDGLLELYASLVWTFRTSSSIL